jgi:hypothetical protein
MPAQRDLDGGLERPWWSICSGLEPLTYQLYGIDDGGSSAVLSNVAADDSHDCITRVFQSSCLNRTRAGHNERFMRSKQFAGTYIAHALQTTSDEHIFPKSDRMTIQIRVAGDLTGDPISPSSTRKEQNWTKLAAT